MTAIAIDVESLRDYCQWHVEMGRGKNIVTIDRRGLSFLTPEHHDKVAIGLPPDDEMFGNGKVFVRAVF